MCFSHHCRKSSRQRSKRVRIRIFIVYEEAKFDLCDESICKELGVILCNGRDVCVCVCVCVREREKEREHMEYTKKENRINKEQE